MNGTLIAQIKNAAVDNLHKIKASLVNGMPNVKMTLSPPIEINLLPPIVRRNITFYIKLSISGSFTAKSNKAMSSVEFEGKKPSLCIEGKQVVGDGFEESWTVSINPEKGTLSLSSSLTGPLGSIEYTAQGNQFIATYSEAPVEKNESGDWSFEGTCNITVTITAVPLPPRGTSPAQSMLETFRQHLDSMVASAMPVPYTLTTAAVATLQGYATDLGDMISTSTGISPAVATALVIAAGSPLLLLAAA